MPGAPDLAALVLGVAYVYAYEWPAPAGLRGSRVSLPVLFVALVLGVSCVYSSCGNFTGIGLFHVGEALKGLSDFQQPRFWAAVKSKEFFTLRTREFITVRSIAKREKCSGPL